MEFATMASNFFPTTTRMLASPSSSRTSVPNQILTSSSPRASLSTNFLSPFVGGSVTGDYSGQKILPAHFNPYTSSPSGSHAKRGVVITGGNAWGEAALLLAAGSKGNRSALPSSTIMIKQPIARFQGQATDVDLARKEVKNVKIELVKLYSEAYRKIN